MAARARGGEDEVSMDMKSSSEDCPALGKEEGERPLPRPRPRLLVPRAEVEDFGEERGGRPLGFGLERGVAALDLTRVFGTGGDGAGDLPWVCWFL